MKFRDFQRVVDENPWLARIELSNWGEVFLNPELGEMARYAYRRHVDLRAGGGANLNTVSEDLLETLVKYRFRMITCAIDGAGQETYAQYRRNGDFETVIRNRKEECRTHTFHIFHWTRPPVSRRFSDPPVVESTCELRRRTGVSLLLSGDNSINQISRRGRTEFVNRGWCSPVGIGSPIRGGP